MGPVITWTTYFGGLRSFSRCSAQRAQGSGNGGSGADCNFTRQKISCPSRTCSSGNGSIDC